MPVVHSISSVVENSLRGSSRDDEHPPIASDAATSDEARARVRTGTFYMSDDADAHGHATTPTRWGIVYSGGHCAQRQN
jgi:hypothetical protein